MHIRSHLPTSDQLRATAERLPDFDEAYLRSLLNNAAIAIDGLLKQNQRLVEAAKNGAIIVQEGTVTLPTRGRLGFLFLEKGASLYCEAFSTRNIEEII